MLSKAHGRGVIANFFGKKSALFCSEAFYVFIDICCALGVIEEDILRGYKRELFSPADAYTLMLNNPLYFREI